jgi:hypothetical protein
VRLTARRSGAAIGLLAAAVLAGGLVAVRDRGAPMALREAPADPVLTAAPSLTPAATTPAPPPTTPPAVPTATRPTAAPASEVGGGDPLPSLPLPVTPPPPPPPVTPAPEPPVSVTVSRAALPAATRMIVTVRWRNEPGSFVEVGPGDGHPPFISDGCYHRERADVTYGDEWAVARYEWSYRRAGTYDIVARLRHNPCDGDGTVTTIATSAPARVVVTPGADVANGPWQPHLTVSATTEPPPAANPDWPAHRVTVNVGTWDADGWLWKVVLDWGDGSDPELLGGVLEDCRLDGDYGGDPHPYPATTWPWGGMGGGSTWHDLPGPGTYVVTATATSSGCDGGDAQTVTRHVTVTVT